MEDPDDIVIVGVGCRFPGADNLDEFWRVLSNGENHVIDIPRDRWNVDAFYDADPDAPGKTYVRKAGIVTGHDMFDNKLFDMNDIEASKMDPQQRFVLESTFMALEDAGIPRSEVSATKTGVYIGVMNSDYTNVLASDLEQADNYTLTGGSASIASARVSYAFNFLGPALTVDTACSSALVAIHLASQALKLGDCDMAICGGVNCIMLPTIMVPLSKARMVSPSGASRAFSAEADGYARGEGCGIVVLKRRADVLARGDRIWASIKTASNQDGRMASPITAPSGTQQGELLRETYARYCINTADIQYIEAHGTGTPVGDPIEANCLCNFFGGDDVRRYIGSVKTNIGHTESAAGAAGLIKVLLMMKHGTIVPTLHFVNPNPKIDFPKFGFNVPTECHPWSALCDGRRIACVNSFGFGGSNGHAIVLQQPDIREAIQEIGGEHIIIAISGQSKAALRANVTHLISALSQTEINLRSLSYTSTCRRDHYQYRAAVHVRQDENVTLRLDNIKDGTSKIPGSSRKKLNLVFVFGGMGTSWEGMCAGLLEKEHKFLETMRAIDRILEGLSTISVENEVRKQTDFGHPVIGPLLLFACQVGLVSVWESWGVKASRIVGQSVGEVAAAYASGKLSLADAVGVIFHRTEMLAKVTSGEMMAILNCPVSIVEDLCLKYDGRINVAVYYSPSACAVSGDSEHLQSLKETLGNRQESGSKHTVVALKVSTAFHSHRMDPLMEPLTNKLAGIKRSPQTTPIYSSVTGKLAEHDDFVTPKYWAKNLRQPVLFYQAVANARLNDAHNVFIEIGPSPVLRAHLNHIFTDDDVSLFPSMDKGSDSTCMLESLCNLFSIGFNPRWENIVPQHGVFLTDEPKYQFQRVRRLYESHISRMYRDGTASGNKKHPFVNRIPAETPKFSVKINKKVTPFVFEHFVRGVIVVPGAVYAEVALVIGCELLQAPTHMLQVDVRFIQPVVVLPDQEVVLTCQVQHLSSSSVEFTVFKQNHIHASGYVRKGEHIIVHKIPTAKIRQRCTSTWTHSEIYEYLGDWGFQYGKDLSILQDAVSNQTECLASIQTTDLINNQLYGSRFHPSVLDAMVQAVVIIGGMDKKTILPVGIGCLSVNQAILKNMICYAKCMKMSSSKFICNVLLMKQNGNVIAEARELAFQVIGENSHEAERVAFSLRWEPITRVPHKISVARGDVVAITDDKSFCNSLVGGSKNLSFFHLETSCFSQAIEKVKEFFSAININKKVTALVFHQGTNFPPSSGNDVFGRISQIGKNVRDLIIFLAERNLTIPVTILTQNTQSIEDVGEPKQVNIYGSTLWGMIRCLLKENLYPHLQLVDIWDVSQATVATLLEHVTDADISKSTQKELIISHGEAFESRLQFSREKAPLFLGVEQKWNGNDEVRILQAPDTFPGKVCLQHRPKVTPPSGHTRVVVNTALLHKRSVFPVTVADNNQAWSDLSTDDAQIICLEADGRFEDGNKQDGVIAFVPFQVASVVSLPAKCLIPRTAIPCYQVGLVTILTFTYHVYAALVNTTQLVIIVDEVSIKQANLMQGILELFGREGVKIVHKSDAPKSQIDEPSSILLLANLVQSDLHIISKSDKVHQVMAFRGCNGDYTLESCCVIQNAFETIRFVPKQIVQLSQITRTLPLIVRKIAQRKAKFQNLFQNLCHAHFSMISDGILDLQSTPDLRLLTTAEFLFRPNASYVVVGGLGGLGWLTVSVIAEMGGGLIATVSRSPPNEEMQSKISTLKERTGAKIVCLQADICNLPSLENALNRLSTNFPTFPLKGIFQGAGILDDAFLMSMSTENFDKVCLPKVKGTYNLHEVTKSQDLDYFVMHSSIVSIAGNAGQTNYGAGNSFVDTFAHFRRSKGLPGQSINWGPLDVGMAVNNSQIEQQLRKAGFLSLNKEQIKNCLLHSLLTNRTHICFVDFDWIEKQRHFYLEPDLRPLIMMGGNHRGDEQFSHHIDLHVLKQKTPAERCSILYEYMKQVISAVVAVDVSDLEKQTALSTLGLDSMMAMTLANQLRRDLNIMVPLTKLLEDISVEDLVLFLDTTIMSNDSTQITVDSVDEHLLFAISPLQEMVYENYTKWKGLNDVIFGCEICLKIPVTFQWVKDVIITLVRRHESLRTMFMSDEGVLKPFVVQDIPDIDIPLLKSDNVKEVGKEMFKISEKPFDLSKELPIRIICVETMHQFNLGFVLHSISFDLKSIGLFFEDFKRISLAKVKESNIAPSPRVNVAYEMGLALESRMKQLAEFWRTRINAQTEIPLISLVGKNAKPGDLCGRTNFVVDYLTSDLQIKLDKRLSSWNVSSFQFLSSAYGLLLYLITGETKVALRTAVDTRQHIPKLRNVIARCVNGIPLLCEIDTTNTIHAFVTSTAKETLERVSNGLYPGKLIIQNASKATASNLARHSVVMEDMANIQSIGTGLEEFNFKFSSNGAIRINHETRVVIWYKQENNICIQLDFISTLLTTAKAKELLSSYIALIEYIVSNPLTCVRSIPRQILTTFNSGHNAASTDKSDKNEQEQLSHKLLTENKHPTGQNSTLENNTEQKISGGQLSKWRETNIADGNIWSEEKSTNERRPIICSKTVDNDSFGGVDGHNLGNASTMGRQSGFDVQLKMDNTNLSSYRESSGVQSCRSYFFKSTKQGLKHGVYLRLEGSTLSWGRSADSLPRRLYLKNVVKINLNIVQDEYIIIFKTRTRRYYFSTADSKQAGAWMKALRSAALGDTAGPSSKPFSSTEDDILY